MLITFDNGTRVDYGIVSVEHPFMEVVAVESSFYKTPLSGNDPAIMVFQLPDLEVFQTTKFTATRDCGFSEFIIKDKALIRELAPKLHKSYPLFFDYDIRKLKQLGIVQVNNEWNLFARYFPDDPDDDDPFTFLDINCIYWVNSKEADISASYLRR